MYFKGQLFGVLVVVHVYVYMSGQMRAVCV